MKIKRIISVGVLFCMLLSVLTGCGLKKEEKTKDMPVTPEVQEKKWQPGDPLTVATTQILVLNESYLGAFNGRESMPEQVAKKIVDFQNMFYYSRTAGFGSASEPGTVLVPDMTGFFAEPDGISAAIWQNALEYLLTADAINDRDMSLSYCSYDLNVFSVEEDGTEMIVRLYEDYVLNFTYLSGILSRTWHQALTFRLTETADGWMILSFYREEDFFLSIYNAVDEGTAAANIPQLKEVAVKYYQDNYKRMEADRAAANAGEVNYDVTVDHAYDRSAAAEYATQHVTDPNPAYPDFSSYGGNCQNFASQTVLAGGIPMDMKGDDRWKYYNDDLDNGTGEYGRTSSWTGAASFHDYALLNFGYGLSATVDANLFSAAPGDIFQVGGQPDVVSHSTVVVDRYMGSDGILEILLDSNSNIRENWPMTASYSTQVCLIKIHGWNEE